MNPPFNELRRIIRFDIPPDRAGVSLLDFLVARFSYRDREAWTAELEAGRLSLNGVAARPDAGPLVAGDLLEYKAADVREPDVDMAIGVVFEDEDLLVIDKPANLPVHPSGRYFNHTLWAILKTRFGLAKPLLVNRLDRETSGLVVVAKNEAAAKGCRHQFAGRWVEKRYVALAEGAFPEAVEATGWMIADPGSGVRKKRRFVAVEPPAGDGPGEPAATRFRRLALHGPVSEVEAVLLTGRLHQIRATLQALGFPLVGDKLYGGDASIFLRFCRGELTAEDRRRLRMERQALHAAGLVFRHPRLGRVLTFEAPLPADMLALIRELEAASSAGSAG